MVLNKTIVLSGINLYEGGPLSIFYDCLNSVIALGLQRNNNIIAFVHNKNLFRDYFNYPIEFIELPKSRKNYIYRIYYEYFYFKKYSKKKNIDYWFSLHDITPNVKTNFLFTYCHNPSPFRTIDPIDFRLGLKNLMFVFFYRFIYRINIKRTSKVIVQQIWMKNEFEKRFRINNLVVAHPLLNAIHHIANHKEESGIFTFLYPSFPRAFKNFEVICEAVKKLSKKNYLFRVIFTINGTENKYSKLIFRKYKSLNNIVWMGPQSRDAVFDLYDKIDCLIFSSKIETWGLPITEFEPTKKSMLVANEPYARETVGNYEKVSFFEKNNADELCKMMEELIMGTHVFEGNRFESIEIIYNSWDKLLSFLFGGTA